MSLTNGLENLESLISYISSRGARISGVDFTSSEVAGCGIVSKNKVDKGTVLISVPYNICINVGSVSTSAQLKVLFENNPGFLDYPDEVLAIGLMYAKTHPTDTTCEWLNHVITMPDTFNTTIFWSEDELLELKDSFAFHLTRMMKNQIANDYEQLYKPLIEEFPDLLGAITIDLYKWALSIVYSRSIEITRQNKHVRCIVPVLDMANHNPESASSSFDTFHYDDESDQVALLSSGDLEAGEECFAIYGNYPNAKLIYNYGFVILNNPHRAIDLWTRLPPTSFQHAIKEKALSSHELTREQTYDFKGTIRPNFISPALLATIRVIQANDEHEISMLENAFTGRMIGVRNELASYVSLRNLILLRLKPEQAEPDRLKLGELLLSGASMADRLVCALVVRVEERELLQEALQLVTGWMEQLEALGDAYVPPDAPTTRT